LSGRIFGCSRRRHHSTGDQQTDESLHTDCGFEKTGTPEKSKHFDKWPAHCVQHTYGAAFFPQLDDGNIDEIFLKGTGGEDDGYSAFEATNKDLDQFLKAKHVEDVYVCGLATDYCVLASALDARIKGFNVFVIADAIRGVEVNKGDVERAIEEMKHKGIVFVDSSEVPALE
jgi:nicotinamidase/pyrazinamidase